MTKKLNSYRKFLAAAATATLVASVAAPLTSAAANGFTDLPQHYQEAVDFLVSTGAKGTTSTTFGTYDNIKRVDAAILLANILELDTENAATSGFKDVPARGIGAVNALKEAGITQGKTADSFGAYDLITRGELASWIQKGFELTGSTTLPFTDVAKNYQMAVQALVSNEITQGISKTEFGLYQPAKRGDYAIFLYKAHLAQIEETPSEVSTSSLIYFQDAHEITPVTRDDGERGSISRLSTVIDQQQSLYPNSSVVFGGDLAGGTLFGGLYRGEPFVEAFNQIGVDVASFGQHDFDFGAQHTKKLINDSNFSWVSSNLVNKDETPFTENTTYIQEMNGVRIGYIGLTGDMSNTSASGEVIEKDDLESAKVAVEELQSQNVDAIVAITQIGLEDNQEILNEIPAIDIALREENSSVAESDITVLDDGRLIVSPEGDYGSVVRVDITFKPNGEKTFNYEVIQVDENVDSDPILKELEDSYVQDMEAKLDIKIATATSEIKHRQKGYLIADAFRDWTNADLGWVNGGGVRSTSIPAGDITLRNLYSIQPFGNRVMLLEVTGEQLKLGVEQAGNSSDSYSGGYSLPSGFTYKYDPSASEGNKILDLKLEDGTPIEPAQTYSLAITNYVYNGGNGVTAFKDAKVLMNPDEGTQDVNALIEYVTEKGEITPETELREYYIGQDSN